MGASAKTVDLSGVKDRGNFNPKQVPEGDYAAIITKVEDAEAKDGEFQYLFTFKLEKYSQNSYPYYCKLVDNQLWKLRNVLIAAGINVPKSRLKVDPNKAVGKKVGVTMEDDEYNGKMKSVIGAVFPVSELSAGSAAVDDDTEGDEEGFTPEVAGDTDEVEAKPKKKKDKKKKKDVEELDITEA